MTDDHTVTCRTVTCRTVACLHSIKKGEKVIYYRGNLTKDMRHSKGHYKDTLDAIKCTVDHLVASERIAIQLNIYQRGTRATYQEYEYVAVGLCD